MKSLLTTPLLLVLLFIDTSPASAQCELSTAPAYLSTAAIDRGRAIVAQRKLTEFPHAHFYEKSGQGWQPGEIFAIGDRQLIFPMPVALDADRAIAGCPESIDLEGQAFVFDRVGSRWVQTELVSATTGFGDFFGASVDVSGEVAVVGASHWGPDGIGDQLGRVHVFEFDGTNWTEVTQLMTYGAAVDVEGDTIVVGDNRTLPGRVQIFRKEAGLWTWKFQITPYDSLPGAPYLGSAVDLQGDTLAVGAALPYPGAGYVKVYRRLPANGGWPQTDHLVAADSAANNLFGHSVALSGSTLLVGAPGAGSFAEGAVYRFERIGANFVETGRIGGPQDPPEGRLGTHVALQREDGILSSDYTVSFFRLGFAHVTPFCPTTPNSTGSPGTLSVEGCDSLGGERLTLVASGLPAGVLGACFFGAGTTQVPFGDGFRCVGSPFFRLPSGTSDGSGRLIHDVDFSSGPASHLTAGQTWHFQAYHRDPGTGAHLNLTNALSIGITP